MSEATKAAEAAPAEGQAAEARAPMQVEVNDAAVMALYANFCRVTGSPEELIIDFGLNPQPMGVPTKPISVTQRIVVNYWTAKRLMQALAMSIQRHEAFFGVLETDINKRVKAQPRAAKA